jgi:hypothetical protein
VQEWIDEPQYMTEDQLGKRMHMISMNEVRFREIISKASQYGADRELEACCEWLDQSTVGMADLLRADRRPKPPSLKEQALSELNLTADPDGAELSRTQVELIRQALEALDD